MKFNKIADFERLVLSFVNSHLDTNLFLHGLSEKAIEEWSKRNPLEIKLKKYLQDLNKSLQEKRISHSYTLISSASLPPTDKIKNEIDEIFSE